MVFPAVNEGAKATGDPLAVSVTPPRLEALIVRSNLTSGLKLSGLAVMLFSGVVKITCGPAVGSVTPLVTPTVTAEEAGSGCCGVIVMVFVESYENVYGIAPPAESVRVDGLTVPVSIGLLNVTRISAFTPMLALPLVGATAETVN